MKGGFESTMTFFFLSLLAHRYALEVAFSFPEERMNTFTAKPANLTGVCILLNRLLSFHSSADHGTAEITIVPDYEI